MEQVLHYFFEYLKFLFYIKKSFKNSSKCKFLLHYYVGSIGAAIGPFLAGALEGAKDGPKKVFYMLMAADVLALLVIHLKIFFVKTIHPN